MNEAYDAFRVKFGRKARELEREVKYGLLLAVAESHPKMVKGPYKFLSDEAIPRDERLRVIHAAAESTGADLLALAGYVFDTGYQIAPTDGVDRLFSKLQCLIGDARQLITDVQTAGVDPHEEISSLEVYESSIEDIREFIQEVMRALKEDHVGSAS